MNIDIRALSKNLRKAYLSFFDNIAFDENPDRSKCYCYVYHFLGDVDSCTKEQSRSDVSELVNEGKLTGYLVFQGDQPIGWCNVNNRNNYQRLLRDYDHVDNPDDKVCSIVCFLIHPDHRRKGIARQILGRIIKDYSATDFDYLEAYPKKSGHSCEANFKGPLELYTTYDFKIHKEHDSYYVVRKYLR